METASGILIYPWREIKDNCALTPLLLIFKNTYVIGVMAMEVLYIFTENHTFGLCLF